MLLETTHGIELSVAQVALKGVAIPGLVRCPVAMPFDLLLHNHSVRITAANGTVDCLAIQVPGLGTAAALQMVGNSTCRDKGSITEWTYHVRAHVNSGFEVLDICQKKKKGKRLLTVFKPIDMNKQFLKLKRRMNLHSPCSTH